jgi:hypothetical protein
LIETSIEPFVKRADARLFSNKMESNSETSLIGDPAEQDNRDEIDGSPQDMEEEEEEECRVCRGPAEEGYVKVKSKRQCHAVFSLF